MAVFPQPLQRVEPLGSLVYEGQASDDIASPGEIDSWTIQLDASQTVSVVVDPDPTLQAAVRLLDPTGYQLGSTPPGSADADVYLSALPVTAAGTYTVQVSGGSSSTGLYRVYLTLNAAVEAEAHGAMANDQISSAQDLQSAFSPLGPGSAERAAVLGKADGSSDVAGPDGFGYQAMAVPYSFEDIRTTGTATLSYADDGFIELAPADLGGFQFSLYGTTYSGLFLSSNGLITFGSPDPDRENSALLSTPAGAALAPLWDDLDTRQPVNTTEGQVFWEVRGTGAGQRLIVQWDKVKYYNFDWDDPSVDRITFQAVLYEADNSVRFNYQDLAGGLDFQSEGASATVGIKAAGSQGPNRLLVSQDSGPNQFVGSQKSTRFGVNIAPAPSADFYRFDLAAGSTATLVLQGVTPGPIDLALYDEAGTPLASAVASANVDYRISDFTADVGASYFARVSGRSARYSLMIARNADFETEPNKKPGEAVDLSSSGVVMGGLISKTLSPPSGAQSASGGAGPANAAAGSDPAAAASDPAGKLWTTGAGSGSSPSRPGGAPRRLIVRFADGSPRAQGLPSLAPLGGRIVRTLPSIHATVVEVPASVDLAEAAQRLSKDPSVLYAEPDYQVHALGVPNDPMFGSLWGLHNTGQSQGLPDADMDAPEAWNLWTGTREVVVAGIDTGVDYNHPDLAANMWVNPGEIAGDTLDNDGNGYVDDIYGIDTFNRDGDPMDDQGHGTHTAGTFGAVGNNGVGIAGVNWRVKIMALKFLGADGSGSTSDAITAIEYMTMMRTVYGVNVVVSNNSWGGGGYSKALEEAIAASINAGILFVAAAGNNAGNNDAAGQYPASYPLDGIISVAATDRHDVLAYFSNYGATTVHLAAPGVDILSTLPNNDYDSWSGTSMASPHVAGAAALLRSFSPTATVIQVKTAILDGADSVTSLEGVTITGGRLNLNKSLAMISDAGDYYRVQAVVGDTLTIRTRTPGGGVYQFDNILDPAVELYGPAGALLASNDNGAGDYRNALVTYPVTASGAYLVRVISAAGGGEYVLEVTGPSGPRPAFAVQSVAPADGESLPASPAEVTVAFNHPVYLPSLAASDLSVDGLPAGGLVVLDGRSVAFSMPSLVEGNHRLEIAAGSVLDVRRIPVGAFSSQFVVDLTGPRLVSSSIQDGQSQAAGDLVYTAQFSERLKAAGLDRSDVELVGLISGKRQPGSLTYDPATSTLVLQFSQLPDDSYTLTLTSADGAFEDLAGNDLDGESPRLPIPPNQSGDGVPGGDFVLHFSLDAGEIIAQPFQRLDPLGGMIFASPENQALIESGADTDSFSFVVQGGQTITAYAVPLDPAATLSLVLTGSTAIPVHAVAPGQAVVLPPARSGSGGAYAIQVSADLRTGFTLWIGLNTVVEGPDQDTSDGSELPATDSKVTLAGSRYGAVAIAALPEGVVWGVQPASGQIVLLDTATGRQLHHFRAPDQLLPSHTQIGLSIAEGGQTLLYVNADVDPTRLYRLDAVTGAVLSTSTLDGRAYDGLAFQSQARVPMTIYSANMDTDPGWTLDPPMGDGRGWEYGVPQGGGSFNHDPFSGHTGSNVIGYALGLGPDGNYPTVMSEEYATTPAIDCSQFSDVRLSFYRWLGIDGVWGTMLTADAHAAVQVSNDGNNWVTIWNNDFEFFPIQDFAWLYQSYDISAVADGRSTVYIRWAMGFMAFGPTAYPGWNIDDVLLTGTSVGSPSIFLGQDQVAVRKQTGYSGSIVDHLTTVQPSGALGGDDAGRLFAFVPGQGIVEYDPATPQTVLRTLPAPAADVEGLAFDGKHLYASTASGLLFGLSPDSGTVLTTTVVPNGALFGLGAFRTADQVQGIFYSETFDGPSHSFSFDNNFGSAGGLWHVTTGRQSDQLANHSPPKSVYFGRGETDAGGGNYDTGSAVGGLAMTPFIALPNTVPITLSFHSLIYVEEPYDAVMVAVDDGENQSVILSSYDGTLPTSTGGTWQTFTVDLGGYAGRTIRLWFYFDTGDQENNFYEGWYIDDVRVFQPIRDARRLLPDVDEYTVDLAAGPGHKLDIVLAGQSDDFSSARLDLLDTDAQTVLATASAAPLGTLPENYDLGLLGFDVPASGTYTVRVTSTVAGAYALVVSDAMVFDSEPQRDPSDPLRRLAGGSAALGYVGQAARQRLFAAEWADAGQHGLIHELDPLTGAILHTFPTPNLPNTGPDGINLAYDGKHLWYNAGADPWGIGGGDNFIFKLDPDDGHVIDSFYDPYQLGFIGLARVGRELFATDTMGTISVYDVADPAHPLVRQLSAPGFVPDALAGNDAAGTLLVVAQRGIDPYRTIYELNAKTGAQLRTARSYADIYENGAAVVGDELFISDGLVLGAINQIEVYDLATLSLQRKMEIRLDTLIGGLGGDGFLGDLSDFYEIALTAGQTLWAYTETPQSGAAGLVNDLDPALALWSPSGVQVAGDSNSLDGKNARLRYTVQETGLYRIELKTERGMGEYVLRTSSASQLLPELRINDVDIIEGHAGTLEAVFTVTLSANPTSQVTVQLDSLDGSATAAGDDYLPVSGMVLTFYPGGSLTQQAAVTINGDTRVENDEFFLARLSAPLGAVIADPEGSALIRNDDILRGTPNADTIKYYREGNQHRVIINTTEYIVDEVRALSIDALGGSDAVWGYLSALGETAHLHSGWADVAASTYNLYLAGAEQIYLYSMGGVDEADFYDGPQNDRFTAMPASSAMQYQDGTLGFAAGFRVTEGHATAGGTDTAIFYDSAGDDSFTGRRDQSSMRPATGAAYDNTASAFEKVYAYTSTGVDAAGIADAGGQDSLLLRAPAGPAVGRADMFYYGGIVTTSLQGFDAVTATSTDPAIDLVNFYDSPGNDTYVGRAGAAGAANRQARLYDSDGPGVGYDYDYTANGFGYVYVLPGTAAGGNDVATITGSAAGTDRYTATTGGSALRYANNDLQSLNVFEQITVNGNGGTDFAVLYDTVGNDQYDVTLTQARLQKIGGGYDHTLNNFTWAYAYGTAGGYDTANFTDGAGNDRMTIGSGAVNDSVLTYQTGQFAFGRGFETVQATSTGGANDQALLYDTAANDVYTAMSGGANEAAMLPQSGSAYSRRAIGFDKYYAYSIYGGTDEAHLYDSPGNDLLQAGAGNPLTGARTKSPLETTLNYNIGSPAEMLLWTYAFEKLTAHGAGTPGDADAAYFYDDPAQSETFTADPAQARFKRNTPGWDITAEAFRAVYAFGTMTPANPAITDAARITDSAMHDLVRAWGQLNEGYIKYNYVAGLPETYDGFVDAKGFDSLKFQLTTGGIDEAFMFDSAGNDAFTGSADWAQLVDALGTYFHRIEGLSGGATGDRVTIRSDNGGYDTATLLGAIDYALTKVNTWH